MTPTALKWDPLIFKDLPSNNLLNLKSITLHQFLYSIQVYQNFDNGLATWFYLGSIMVKIYAKVIPYAPKDFLQP